MATVVLLGFSTTGKSTILGDFANEFRDEDLQTIDTDKQIVIPEYAATEKDAHIYLVFNKLVNGCDRKNAVEYIERREEEVLELLKPVKHPRLIAAGPAVPSRKEWKNFMQRVNPFCFYLEKTAEEVYQGLLKRREKFPKEISERADFGSWDEDVITKCENGKWLLIPKSEAITNITKHMTPLVKIYQSDSQGRKYRSLEILNDTNSKKTEFYAQVRNMLGLRK